MDWGGLVVVTGYLAGIMDASLRYGVGGALSIMVNVVGELGVMVGLFIVAVDTTLGGVARDGPVNCRLEYLRTYAT